MTKWKETSSEPSRKRLHTYTDKVSPLLGELEVKVKSGQENEEVTLLLLVIKGEGVSLLGRDWLKEINLEWKEFSKYHRLE